MVARQEQDPTFHLRGISRSQAVAQAYVAITTGLKNPTLPDPSAHRRGGGWGLVRVGARGGRVGDVRACGWLCGTSTGAVFLIRALHAGYHHIFAKHNAVSLTHPLTTPNNTALPPPSLH